MDEIWFDEMDNESLHREKEEQESVRYHNAAEAEQHERDQMAHHIGQLRAELAAANERAEFWQSEHKTLTGIYEATLEAHGGWMAEADAMGAHVERLRAALADILAGMPEKNDDRLKYREVQFRDGEVEELRQMVAETPATSLAKVKAEALMEMYRQICAAEVQGRISTWFDAATMVHDEADRLANEGL